MKDLVAFFADRPELLTLVLILAEITLIGGVALAICRIWRNDAAARYGVAFTALLLIWLAVPATLALRAGGYSTVEMSRTLYTTPAPALTAAELSEIAKLPLLAPEPAPANYQVPWWVYLWVAGTAAILVRFAVGFWRVRRLRRQAAPLPHLKGAAPVFLTEEVAGPVVIGALRPSVLIPSSILDGLSESELHDVLAHEFAHVARRHLLVAIMQRLTVALFWPHPFVHLLSRHLVEAREEICDNVVLRSAGRARYARVLLRVAECRRASGHFSASLGLFGPNSNLEERVKGLLDPHRRISTEMNYPRIALVALMLVSGAAALAGARVQTELVAAPIFDGAQLPPTHQAAKSTKAAKQAKEKAERKELVRRKLKAELEFAQREKTRAHALRDEELVVAKKRLIDAQRKIEVEIATIKEKKAKSLSEDDALGQSEKHRAEAIAHLREHVVERGDLAHNKAQVEKEIQEAIAQREKATGDIHKVALEKALLEKRIAERASSDVEKVLREKELARASDDLALSQRDQAKVMREKAIHDLAYQRGLSNDERQQLIKTIVGQARSGQDQTAAMRAKIAAQQKEIDRLNELLRKLRDSKGRGGDERSEIGSPSNRLFSARSAGRLEGLQRSLGDIPSSGRSLFTRGTARLGSVDGTGRLYSTRSLFGLRDRLRISSQGRLKFTRGSLFERTLKKDDKPKKQPPEDPFFVGDRITL